jgi:GxxExxY protein
VILALGAVRALELDHRGHRGSTEDVYPEVSSDILQAAFKVHSALGPGLLESAYEGCLCHELHKANIAFRRQVPIPLAYDGLAIDCGFRLDILVMDKVIVEVKAVERLLSLHSAQLHTYLKASGLRLGLLLNFNTRHLRDGIRRLVL